MKASPNGIGVSSAEPYGQADRQTDGQTDRQALRNWRESATKGREGEQEPEEKHLETCEMFWGPGMNNVDGTATWTWTWTGEEGSGHYH